MKRVHITRCNKPAWDELYEPEQFIVTYGEDDSVGKELLRRYYQRKPQYFLRGSPEAIENFKRLAGLKSDDGS